MKQVTFTAEEFDLVFNLLQDHLDDVLQDEFFHTLDHQKAQEAQGLTVDALRSMKAYMNDSLEAECFEGEVRLPGERRHKNRIDTGPRNINEELVNKIKSLS